MQIRALQATVGGLSFLTFVLTPLPSSAQSYQSAYEAFANNEFKRSRRELEDMGDALPPEGQYLLGLEYIQGLGGRRKSDSGIELIKSAARMHNPSAMAYLVRTRIEGDRRYISESEARSYLAQLEQAGDLSASGVGGDDRQIVAEPKRDVSAKDVGSEARSELPTDLTEGLGDNQSEVAESDYTGGGEPLDLLKDTKPIEAGADDQTSEAVQVVEAAKDSVSISYWFFGAAAAAIGLLIYAFSGVRCPNCGKRRVSDLVGQQKLGQFTKTRMQTAVSRTQHKDA